MTRAAQLRSIQAHPNTEYAMSFASEFRAAIRAETDEELHRMVQADDMLSRIAQDELRRRERGGVREVPADEVAQ